MIGTDGERESNNFVLSAQIDDDDNDDFLVFLDCFEYCSRFWNPPLFALFVYFESYSFAYLKCNLLISLSKR